MAATVGRAAVRSVSIIAPMWNEADHIGQFVEDLAAQEFDRRMEILIADGCSTDGSAQVLEDAAARCGLAVQVVANPARAVSHGLNACIRRATGDVVVRLDCHTRYPSDYLARCVAALEETGAWNAGGVAVPKGRTRMERAVACAMDSPFGGIVWTRHASTPDRVDVDTVPFGAFPREVFDRVGLFDEKLVRDQDDEFNLRLRLAGGRVVLDPTIRVNYVPRGSLRGVARQYYEYGFWKVAVMRKHRQVLGVRSMVPIAFVGSVGLLALVGVRSRAARRLLAAELAAYTTGAIGFATAGVAGRRERLNPLRVAAVFPAFHLSYGVGMLHGWLAAVAKA